MFLGFSDVLLIHQLLIASIINFQLCFVKRLTFNTAFNNTGCGFLLRSPDSKLSCFYLKKISETSIPKLFNICQLKIADYSGGFKIKIVKENDCKFSQGFENIIQKRKLF